MRGSALWGRTPVRALDLRRGGARGGGGSTSHVGADASCSATPASSWGYKTSPALSGGAAAAPASVQTPSSRRTPPSHPSAPRRKCFGPAKTHVVLRPPPGLRRSAPAQLAASGHPWLRRGSWRADRSPSLALRTEVGGAASCGPHTLYPTAAAAPELCAQRPSPSRAHNFGSPVGLLEEAESAPSPEVRPSSRHRAWEVATESEISSGV